MAMSLKKLFTTSYCEKTYKHAVDLQKIKVKASPANLFGKMYQKQHITKVISFKTAD